MTAKYPKLVPSSRSFDYGDYANTKYRANSGAEFRIQFGSKRTGMKMQLVYQNIKDADAKKFFDHFDEVLGTFKTFIFDDGLNSAKAGWGNGTAADGEYLGAEGEGSRWRYEKAPQLKSVYPGVSTITVNLIAATITTQSASVCDDS